MVAAAKVIKQSDSVMLKMLPQSVEAEEAVLGAILVNPISLGRIIEFLKPESFYKPSHKLIYETMLELFKKNEPIDIVTVSEYLRNEEKLENVGGRAYINDLALNVVTTANIEFYARIIQEKEIKRALINAGSEIVSMSYENEATDIVLDNAQKLIFNIASQKDTSDLIPIQELVVASYEQIEERYNNKSDLIGVTTGFYDLNALTSGLQKSDLIILAARPSMGKTALALNIAQNLAMQEKKGVALFSLEMSKQQLVKRMLCSEAEVDTQRITSGNMQPKDWEKLVDAMTRLSDARIYIDDTSSITVTDIKAKCRRLMLEEKDLGLIVIDYLQLMEGGGNPNDRNQQISQISRSLKGLARELDVPIIALSQLSRGVESRTDKRPMLSDLRDSGAIEQDADIVMFIYRDEYYNKDNNENKGKAEVIIAKHRNGPVGTVELLFQSNITKFKNRTRTTAF
ncbi:MAG: replicative DNA helicase [Candidatus Gastranaerophilales bacterium]|nr:replicative DNA helicase [Candidatus Gastranaerophilales bacterium]